MSPKPPDSADMSVPSDTLQAVLPAGHSGITVTGIGHVAVNVTDLSAAKAFYCDLLGFHDDRAVTMPHCGSHAVLRAASGQRVVLCHRADWRPLPESGIHTAYRVSPAARDAIAKRLGQADVAILTYKEMREAEQTDNFYCLDPAGNRVQLVRGEDGADQATSPDIAIRAIDHAVVQSFDVEWEERFYVGDLGLAATDVVGWRTADYLRARAWGEGKEAMAPGIMRWDKRFFVFPGQEPNVARVNVQLFVAAGHDRLGIYLASQYFQAPPEQLAIGTPRVALSVANRADLDKIADLLRAAGRTWAGPVDHSSPSPWASSLYCRDPGFNFLEFCCP